MWNGSVAEIFGIGLEEGPVEEDAVAVAVGPDIASGA